jgi:hypothetical protein
MWYRPACRLLAPKQMPPGFQESMCSWQTEIHGSLVGEVRPQAVATAAYQVLQLSCLQDVSSCQKATTMQLHHRWKAPAPSCSRMQHCAAQVRADTQVVLLIHTCVRPSRASCALDAGELEMRVFDTPGHTRGHVTFWFPEAKALFPGASLVEWLCLC